MTDCSLELISAGIALISAVGGVFAARAAMESASFAKKSQESAEHSEKREAVTKLVVSVSELDVVLQRINSQSDHLKTIYKSLFHFSGSTNHSSEKLSIEALERKVTDAKSLADEFKSVEFDVNTLYASGIDDINIRFARTQQVLVKVRSISQDIEREYLSAESRLKIYQEKAINKLG